jgi:competence protein ComEC
MPANLLTVGRPDIIRIVLYYLLILIFIYGVNRYKKRSFLLILLFAVGILIFPKQGEGLTVTMLDVGQGEAIYMETGEGLNFLIDGGSIDVNGVGIYRIRPFLLSKGINHIDYAIVTHGDTDHTSGLMELMEDGKIKIVNLILPKIDSSNNRWDREDITINDQDEFKDLKELAAKCKVNLMYIKAGDYIREGKLDITCLHPLEGYMYSSRNAYSTVLSVKYGDFDMLLTGDLEAEGERNITKMPLSQYDVLKVAHHGSKNSTSQEFLKIIKPRLSLISCGKDNRYGHPHEELLERLDDIGSELVITYESGAITIKTDGRRVFMKGYMD